MSISFHEVNQYVGAIKDDLRSVMDKIGKDVINERDENKLPVYSIKSRVKSTESAYLKTKRKSYTSLEQVSDYAGMRILCLFERNIFAINSFLLGYFKYKNIEVNEIKIFNLDDSSYERAKLVVNKYEYNEKLKPIQNKKSGYKSIHYSVSTSMIGNKVNIEIQLRTLLQDVWGELEHSLSYKRGGIHPHIKKSFELLAIDLQSMDALLEHLKDISVKEESGEIYSNDKSGPRDYLDYEEDLLPSKFKTELKEDFKEYSTFMKSINSKDKGKYVDDIVHAKGMYENLSSKLSASDLADKNTKYWHDMENAYLLFCDAKYIEALKIYTSLSATYHELYCLHFRIGEIHLKLGNVEAALTKFDESEKLIKDTSTYNKKNLFDIKVMLALVYWLLGDEYIKISLDEILQAEKIYLENKEGLEGRISVPVLMNNLCWYHLAYFIATQDEDDYNAALERFVPLQELIENDNGTLSCNALDSAAWFYYNKFLYKKDQNDAKKAMECCMKMKDRFNYTSFNFSSVHVQFNHIKEIMSVSQQEA